MHRGGKRGPPLLLRDRPLVEVAGLEELVGRGEPVLLRITCLLAALAGVLLRLNINFIHGRPVV